MATSTGGITAEGMNVWMPVVVRRSRDARGVHRGPRAIGCFCDMVRPNSERGAVAAVTASSVEASKV